MNCDTEFWGFRLFCVGLVNRVIDFRFLLLRLPLEKLVCNGLDCVGYLMFVVNGVEYAFGAHESSSTGIFEVEPKKCPGFTFRKSILVGKTDLVAKEVRVYMEKLAEEYQGNKYHLITRNCNHFCNEVCIKLTQKSIPRWVNRLARLGKPNQTECYYVFVLL